MLAQGLTVGVLLVTAGLAAGSQKDAERAAANKEDEMYTFKKGSRKFTLFWLCLKKCPLIAPVVHLNLDSTRAKEAPPASVVH